MQSKGRGRPPGLKKVLCQGMCAVDYVDIYLCSYTSVRILFDFGLKLHHVRRCSCMVIYSSYWSSMSSWMRIATVVWLETSAFGLIEH